MTKPSLFIVLDGVDGCGKSTQARLLVEALGKESERAPLHLREPGSTALGEGIRALLLTSDVQAGPAAEALLFAAARRQMLDELVCPALDEGRDVVCERFHASTYAYQVVASGLGEEAVLALLSTWAGEPEPDVVVILDLEVEEAGERRGATEADRIEARGVEFQRRVAEGYRRYAEREARAVVIDGTGTPEDVLGRVLREVQRARR